MLTAERELMKEALQGPAHRRRSETGECPDGRSIAASRLAGEIGLRTSLKKFRVGLTPVVSEVNIRSHDLSGSGSCQLVRSWIHCIGMSPMMA